MHVECDKCNEEPLLGADSCLDNPLKHSSLDGLPTSLSSTAFSLEPSGSPPMLIRALSLKSGYQSPEIQAAKGTSLTLPPSPEALPIQYPSDIIMDVASIPEDYPARRTSSTAPHTYPELSEEDARGSCSEHSALGSSPYDTSSADIEEVLRDSPFLDLSSPMTVYEWFKAVLLFPWFVVKMVLFILGFAIITGSVRMLMVGVVLNQPVPRWRYWLVRPWLRFWTGLFLRAGLGFWPRFKGWENYRKAQDARAIIVFNHQSYVDAIVMTAYFAPSGVAKASVANIPFIGAITVALQFLFVTRRGSADVSNRYTQAAGQAVEKMAERAADGRYPLLMVAPEGTTKHGNVLLRFSSGAFVPGRPVLPVLLKYSSRHFDVGWGITRTPWHMYRMLTQFINYLEVEALPVYYPSADEVASPALFAANVRQLMGERLGARLVDQGMQHNVMIKKAGVRVNLSGTALERYKRAE